MPIWIFQQAGEPGPNGQSNIQPQERSNSLKIKKLVSLAIFVIENCKLCRKKQKKVADFEKLTFYSKIWKPYQLYQNARRLPQAVKMLSIILV